MYVEKLRVPGSPYRDGGSSDELRCQILGNTSRHALKNQNSKIKLLPDWWPAQVFWQSGYVIEVFSATQNSTSEILYYLYLVQISLSSIAPNRRAIE